MDIFFERYPESHSLRRITFGEDIAQLTAALQPTLEHSTERSIEIQRQVVEGVLPYGMLALQAGKAYSDALVNRAAGLFLVSSDDRQVMDAEFAAALEAHGNDVVVDLSVLNVLSYIPELWDVLLGAFRGVYIPEASSADARLGVDSLAQMSEHALTWDPRIGSLRMIELDPGDLAAMHARAVWISERSSECSPLTVTRIDILDREDPRVLAWMAPVQIARDRSGISLLSDDLVMRQLAHGLGIATFGTLATLQVFQQYNLITSDDLDAQLLTLKRNYCVDLPFELRHLISLCELGEWRRGPGLLILTRPAFWRVGQAAGIYRGLCSRAKGDDPHALQHMLAAAVLGATRNVPLMRRGPVASYLLQQTAMVANFSATVFAELVVAAQQAVSEVGGDDPLPAVLQNYKDAVSTQSGNDFGARALLALASEMEGDNRQLARRIAFGA